MKFFDLEMSESLAKVANVKRNGGRDIVYNNQTGVGDKCKQWIFHGGYTYDGCDNSDWKTKEDCWVTTTVDFK